MPSPILIGRHVDWQLLLVEVAWASAHVTGILVGHINIDLKRFGMI